MRFEQPAREPRSGRSRLGAAPLLLALLLALLQAATPFGHAMAHAVSQHAVQPVAGHASEWTAATADEKPCALCAADHLPALPQVHSATTHFAATRSAHSAVAATPRSSAPLDVFCRPPPAA